MGQTSPRPPRHVFSRDVTPQCYSSGYMLLDVMGGCQAVAVTLEQPIKCPRLAVRSTATPIMCLCVSVTVCWTLPHYAYCLRELQCLQVSIKVLRRLQSKLKCIHPTISLLCLCHFCLRIVIIIIISCTCIITYIIIVMCRKLTFPPLCLYSCCQDPGDTSSLQSQFTLSYAIVFGQSCNQRCRYKLKDFLQKSPYTFNFSSII